MNKEGFLVDATTFSRDLRMQDFDAIVIGLGGMGSATTYQLATH